MKRRSLCAVAALGAALLVGCADTQGIRSEARLRDATALGLAAAIEPSLAPAPDWWTALGDPALDALVARALEGNPSLRVAAARMARADAGVALARAADAPQVGAGLELNRQQFSENYIYPPPLGGSVQSLGGLKLSGSWALDFFGRNAGVLQAAIGQARAAEAEHDAARVLLVANVARAWIQWARLAGQRELAERSLAQRQEMLALVGARARAGLDNRIELHLNESNQADAHTQVLALAQQIEATRHALAALLGEPRLPAGVAAPSLGRLRRLAVPAELQANWLGRRADIAAARWRVEAARGQVQAARAEFYPNVNLAGVLGFESLGFGQLLRGGSFGWNVGPALRLPIFEGGRLRANLKGSVADEDAAIESYNAAVIDAMREVADQSLALRAVAAQQAQQAQALAGAERAWELARQRQRAGIATDLQVLAAETAVLAQRRQALELAAQGFLAQVGLAQALGGGWQPRPEAPLARVSAR